MRLYWKGKKAKEGSAHMATPTGVAIILYRFWSLHLMPDWATDSLCLAYLCRPFEDIASHVW